MASEIKANKISPATGTAFTIGDSGDTFTVPSGATLSGAGAITVPSGGSLTIDSGATITNNGTGSGFGKVLQVVTGVSTSVDATSSSSYVDTSLSVTITPSSASNTILLFHSALLGGAAGGATSTAWARIYNSTDAVEITRAHAGGYVSTGQQNTYANSAMVGKDTGRSVATTYKVQHRASSGSSEFGASSVNSYLIAVEVE